MLVLLNARSIEHSDHLKSLQRMGTDIVGIMSINHSVVKSVLQEHHALTQKQHLNDQDISQQRHQETIAAILTLRNGDTHTLEKPGYFVPDSSSKTTTAYRERGQMKRLDVQRTPPGFDIENFATGTKKLLARLYFRMITIRMEDIPLAHPNTLQWIFCDPVANQKPWSNFIEWLKDGQGCYWISGKAGSGKSTLMKYLQLDTRTSTALPHWAQDQALVNASFYFWNAGTPLQKSQAGLLRSSLFDVLDQHQDLIPFLVPGLYRTTVTDHTFGDTEITLSELKKAFKAFVENVSGRLKICFFIDGVDEYDGDYNDMIQLLTNLASSSSVKFVVSSRPIPACVEGFADCPKLSLQDLTHHDINLYIKDKLANHRLVKKLELREGLAAAQLVTEISTKSSGVFLWVMLVVKSLIDGLQNFDTVEDLTDRLNELPVDLEMLYKHMWTSMSK
jgi:hypothetical protein